MARKVYVDVTLKVDKDGNIRPVSIIWETGEIFAVGRIKYVCRAAALKAGGGGMRYTIVINNHETYLFNDEGRWFVEAE